MRGTSDIRRAIRLDRRGHYAVLGPLALALWLVQASWCPSLARADMIGINFKGPTQAETGASVGDRTAGVEPQTNWNDAGWWLSADLLDKTGATTAVSVTTNTNLEAYNSYVPIPSDNGNNHLMRGYIYPWPSGSSLTVTISGLGDPFTVHGYSVIVYFDGDNGTDWTTDYTISVGGADVATISGKDLANANFSGTFDDATTDGVGNYVRFTGLTTSSFTLTATPATGSGPINAIQIVSVPEPASASLLALGLASAFAARVRRRAGVTKGRVKVVKA